MKKIVVALSLIAMGIMAQACGSSEKCPAYSQADTVDIEEKV